MTEIQKDAGHSYVPSMPVETYDITKEDWSFFCSEDMYVETAEMFTDADTDNSGFVDVKELAAALAHHIEDEAELEFFLNHIDGVFRIADMKKFHEERINDDLMSLEEF